MSTVAISYGDLKNAKDEAKGVAKKLDKYADAIEKTIINKIKNYNGENHENIVTAKTQSEKKKTQLRELADKFENYARSLEDLKTQCENTDDQVKKKVSSLTATFKSSHGIKDSKVRNVINYVFTSIGNSTAAGRWIGDKVDQFESKCDYLKERIEDWYEFKGGKELLIGALEATLEIAIGVITVVVTIATGGLSLVAVAAIIGGIITTLNGAYNLRNELDAYYYTKWDNDPAKGKRYRKLNTFADTLRVESDDKFWHNVASGIEILELACAVVTLVNSCGDLLKKGYKWATNCPTNIKDIKLKEVFKWNTLKSFAGKLKTCVFDEFKYLTKAIKTKDLTYFKTSAFIARVEFQCSLKDTYWNGKDGKSRLNSAKNIFSTTKKLIKDPSDWKNTAINDLVLPHIPTPFYIATTSDKDTKTKVVENINLNNFLKIYNSHSKMEKTSAYKAIKEDVLEKLSTISEINISIPVISVPGADKPGISIFKIEVLEQSVFEVNLVAS